MNKEIKYARFYDISNKLNPEFSSLEYLTSEMEETIDEKTKAYIKENNLNFGDILFVGSSYEGRQQYGFKIVLEDGNVGSGENGYSLPFENFISKELKEQKIKYSKLFEEIENWDRNEDYWSPKIFSEEISLDFKESGLW